MKVISIGTDIRVAEKGSVTQERIKKYSLLSDELHVVVTGPVKSFERITEKMTVSVTGYRFKIVQFFVALLKVFVLANKYKKTDVVVTAQDPFEMGLIAWLSLRNFQVQIHTDICSPFFKKTFLNKIRLIIASIVLPKASGIRVVSERIKKTIIEKYNISPEKIFVLPIRVDVSKALETQPKKFLEFRPTLVTVARLEKEKNVLLAIKVLAEILKKYPDAGLVIVGDGSEKTMLESKTKKLGIEKHVFFALNVPNALSYIRGADIVLIPSYYEGYGLVLAEAAACGTPVISTDVGIAGDLLRHNESALVCPVGDFNCLVDSVCKIIEDSTLKSKLATNARRTIVEAIPSEEKFFEEYKKSIEFCL